MAIDPSAGIPFLEGARPKAGAPSPEAARPRDGVPFLEGAPTGAPATPSAPARHPRRTRLAPSDRCGEATRRICVCSLARCPEPPPVRDAVPIPLGTMAVSNDPTASLEVSALGSCIGLALVDPGARIAAMAHVFLPSAREARRTGCDRGKYADTVVPTLLEAVLGLGARRERLNVYLAGGGQLTGARPPAGAPTIGEANDAAVRRHLGEYGLRVTGSRTGGMVSRSLRVDIEGGVVTTRAIGGPLERI